jgi:Uma2 family endonuclease
MNGWATLPASVVCDLPAGAPSRMTVDEFFCYTQHATKQYQLLDGRVCVSITPWPIHQKVSGNVLRLLDSFVQPRTLGQMWIGPCDVVLDEYNVAQPDQFLILTGREHILTEANVQGTPDLIVEILSPITAELDRGYKRQLYARYRVREYWLVDFTEHQVEVLSLAKDSYAQVGLYGKGDSLTSPLLTGLRIPVDDIFRSIG